jgi:transcriptional regulator with XRE-family HTH domain
MALGERLKRAREAMGLTASEVAAGTNMKVQLVQEIEAENFSRFVAPIYGRGFIKLYAEHVNVDPDPLIAEYMSIVEAEKSGPAPTLKTSGEKRRVKAHVPEAAVETRYGPEESEVVFEDESQAEPDLFSSARRRLLGRRMTPTSSDDAVDAPVGPSFRERCTVIWERIQSRCVTMWVGVKGRLSLRSLRLDAPVKWVAAAIGVLLVLFLVVLLAQLIGGGSRESLSPVVLPEPYVE